MHIVLYQPEIPGNTGNIARLCAATGCTLHLVHPLGFSVDDRHLKRAGLDYWHLLSIHHHEDFASVERMLQPRRFFFNTTKAHKAHSSIQYEAEDVLVFGRETAGLPSEVVAGKEEQCLRIPMIPDARSLNLSNAVAVVVYEVLRQIGYPEMK